LIHRAGERLGQNRSPALIPHITQEVTCRDNSIAVIFRNSCKIPAAILACGLSTVFLFTFCSSNQVKLITNVTCLQGKDQADISENSNPAIAESLLGDQAIPGTAPLDPG